MIFDRPHSSLGNTLLLFQLARELRSPMPGLWKNSQATERLRESVISSVSHSSSRSVGSAAAPLNLISVGSIPLHDNLRCDILRTPISTLGSKSLVPDQPVFAVSRLTVFMRFVPVELDESDTKLRATVAPPSNGKLEYVDARIEIRDSMEPSESEYFNEPLHLADALGGDKHYERIVKAGNALTTDLRKANQNREDYPKARPTGGFIVKTDCPPIVGQLGYRWCDYTEADHFLQPKRAMSQVHKQHKRSASAFSTISNISAPVEAPSASNGCAASHWECEPCGSGTSGIIYCLRPAPKCDVCNIRPLKLLHSSSKGSLLEKKGSPASTLPNKTFKLVAHLLNMDAGQPPEEFFAHFRMAF